ncbi:MAG: chromosome partition protein Smc [Planctomycetota bacterium]|nr:MAG: chromosome partition protein Smc [Planctomycetota bacterium]
MRLIRIEIHGFKSFADRTSLELSPGLTAVVGPNGCGKSNVIDAVKWALGEQRASALRGKDMTDVIFKGNGARAARNFAEVSLVFDNEDGTLPIDYSEVVITRRLFRSGESEYLINKNSSRLKDVRDLLMDTGLGTGAYSVMEQGRIDAILSANPQERRRIFEEAAGISRYRARRREAENKLARTEQNLLRLGDVLEELEKRTRSLKVQAGRARTYLESRDRVSELRALHSAHLWEQLGTALDTQIAGLSELEGLDGAARAALDEVRAEVGVLQARLGDARTAADEAADAFRQATGEVEALSERQVNLRERLAEVAERREALVQRLSGLGVALAERRTELTNMQERLATAATELAARQSVEADAAGVHERATHELETARAEADAERSAALERMEQLTQVRNERSQSEARKAALLASRDRLAERVGELGKQREEQVALQGELFAGARDLDAALEVARSQHDEKSARRTAEAESLQRLDAELARSREDAAALASRKEALAELLERRDGVSPGALSLLESDLPGIEGLLVDHLRAPQHLAEAVEASLGATTQAVVVASRADGLRALEHLHRAQGGRVLLAPRDALRPGPHAAQGRRLLDEVQVLQHAELMEALLGHVRLVSDRAELANCVPDGVTVWVTPDGDLLDERGVLRGGTAGEEGGLVSRRSELDALSARCERLAAELEDLGQRRVQQEHVVAALDEQLEEINQRLRKTETERERTRERERQNTSRREALERELNLRESDLQRLEGEIEEVQTLLSQALDREAVLQQQVEVDREQDGARELELGQLRTQLSATQDALAAARLEVGKHHERREALEAERRQVERGVEERAEALANSEREQAQLAEHGEKLQAELVEVEARASGLTEERDRRAGVLESAKQVAAEVGRELNVAQDAVVARERELESASAALSEHRLTIKETQVRREELRAKVLEELELDLADPRPLLSTLAAEAEAAAAHEALVAAALEAGEEPPALPEVSEEPEPEHDWAAIAAEIEELRAKLGRMGNVNLAAVDELSEVEERFLALSAQRDDLVEAQLSLNDTINKVNKESRERFVEAFEEVREHFRDIFRKLFRGGRADIQLEEGADVLEAGIEITAAPPGKDARTITLLSGGERTMTAVGMLFALFKARPSPVSLLDEVDAALDETNIDRFCSVLEDFLGKSQFLVVTHARRTMSYADTVFGVTMQEHGVSKVLGLSLDEYDAQRTGRGAAQSLEGTPPKDPAAGAGKSKGGKDGKPASGKSKAAEAVEAEASAEAGA